MFNLLTTKNTNTCRWLKFPDEVSYETGCGHVLETPENLGGSDTAFVYCPYRGKRIALHVLDIPAVFFV